MSKAEEDQKAELWKREVARPPLYTNDVYKAQEDQLRYLALLARETK